MRKIKLSSTYAEHAWAKRYVKTPNERTICVPVTIGLGFSCVITESVGESEHSALMGFHIPTDHPQIQHTALNCRRKITQLELDSIIDALEKTNTSYLKDILADMFWLPPELKQSSSSTTKPRLTESKRRTSQPRITDCQQDLFEMA